MSAQRVAKRYAQALLDLAVEHNALDAVYHDMEAVEQFLKQNKQVEAILNNPIIYSYKKLAILKAIFEKHVHPLTMKFMEALSKRNREKILYEIALAFEKLYEEKQGIQRAYVQSAVSLDDKLKASLTGLVAKASNSKQVRLFEQVNPELIGGFVLRIEDTQLDASVRSKLRQIEMELTHA
ncbi:ATP synthase F1 subunit delta [Thermonema rossianum]|uniref:ATP synthase F1 subunit delta n=1 Tax=Thermonema rossianum TaxID=55505 RepID=UPI00056F305D|nr:ATP synthase F1 subunit delta [Thermonema rossianum]